jgi:hypothetical protein
MGNLAEHVAGWKGHQGQVGRVPGREHMPPSFWVGLDLCYELPQLVHSLPAVVRVHVGVFGAKMAPLEAIHGSQVHLLSAPGGKECLTFFWFNSYGRYGLFHEYSTDIVVDERGNPFSWRLGEGAERWQMMLVTDFFASAPESYIKQYNPYPPSEHRS